MANYKLTQTGEEVQRILNSVQTIDNSVTQNSSHPVSGGAVFSYLNSALSNTVAESGVYDVTVNNNNAKFASLSALLNSENLDTLIPIARRKGGMSIKFVHTSDNKYIQARCMAQNFSTDPSDWQGVDDEPTAGSENLVKSGGVSKYLTNNIIAGIGDILSRTQIHGLVSGQSYKITLKENVWSTQGMNPGNYLFAIQSSYNGTFTDIVHLNVSQMANLKKEYVITVPDNSDYIFIGARYPNGQNLEFCINPFYDYSDYQLKGTVATNADLDNAKESGIYKMTGGAIILVTKYSSSNINQARINVNQGGYIEIQNRIFNGTSWGAWKTYQDKYDFKGNFSADTDLDSLYGSDKAGIYKNNTSGGLVLVRYYLTTTIQTYLITTAEGTFTVRTRIRTNNSWSSWVGYLDSIINSITSSISDRLISGKFTTGSQLNSKLENGIWQGTGSIVAVRRLNSDTVVQWQLYNLSDDFTGKLRIQYRSTSNNGQTWESWTNWVDEITEGFIKINPISSAGVVQMTDGCRNFVNPQTYPINNVKYHAANEADIWIDKKTGFMYAVYPENDTTYYETTGRIGMSVFSMATPWNVKHFEAFKTGDVGLAGKAGCAYIHPIESEHKLRLFVQCINSEYLSYKDFDMVTETFGEVHKVQYNGSELTASIINSLIVAAGGSSQNTEFIKPETLYNNTSAKDGYTYQMFGIVEDAHQTKCILRSNDNFESVEFVGVFPYLIRYDSIMDYYDGKFYFLYRKESDTGLGTGDGVYLTTTEDFETYTTPVLVGSMDMRPDIFVNGNNVFLVVGDKRNQGQGFYRTNCNILKGTGSALDGYTKIVNVTDDRGMVNPRARMFGTDIHILASDSPIRLDYENGLTSQWQGKECECYLRIRMT